MKSSIKTKFLLASMFLVLLTVAGLSVTYYGLIQQIMRRQSRQRIRIAFDVVLTDLEERAEDFIHRLDEFLTHDRSLSTIIADAETPQLSETSSLPPSFQEAAYALMRFGRNSPPVDRLALYGPDKQLLILYQRTEKGETAGIYIRTDNEKQMYRPIERKAEPGLGPPPEKSFLSAVPLPPGISPHYEDDIPASTTTQMVREGFHLGVRLAIPVYSQENQSGVLICSMLYTQPLVEQYATLTKTEINLFLPDRVSSGTLQEQTPFLQQELEQMLSCGTLAEVAEGLEIFPVNLAGQNYYQGRCAYTRGEEIFGAIAINISQEWEKQERTRILFVVLIIAGIALVVSFGVSLLLSQKPLSSIQQVMGVIGAVSEGDLQRSVPISSRDEFGSLAMGANQMISHLRTIVDQVQQASIQMNTSAAELSATAREQDAVMDHQLESTEHVVQSVQKISGVTTGLLETMQRVGAMSQEATGFASSGQSDLFRMEEAMRRMEDASTGISEKLETINEKAVNITTVVTTINKVSEQTNLLSLNAAIEAEKAGEYGRGFSVVAREIRRLADQTAVATLDIDRMVQEMQSAVSSGIIEMDKFVSEVQRSAEDVAKISMQLTLIIDQVQALSPNFDEVSVAMGHQSDNAQHIAGAIVQLRDEMQRTKRSLRETYSAIEQLHEAASILQEEVSRFKVAST